MDRWLMDGGWVDEWVDGWMMAGWLAGGWMDRRNMHEKRKWSLGEVMACTSPRSVLITIMIMTIFYGALTSCQALILLHYPLTSPTGVEIVL